MQHYALSKKGFYASNQKKVVYYMYYLAVMHTATEINVTGLCIRHDHATQ